MPKIHYWVTSGTREKGCCTVFGGREMAERISGLRKYEFPLTGPAEI